jgi:hypothetical protein
MNPLSCFHNDLLKFMNRHKKLYPKNLRIILLHVVLGGGGLTIVTNLYSILDNTISVEDLLYSFYLNGALWAALAFGNGIVVDWLDKRISWLEQPVARLIWGLILTVGYTLAAASLILLIYVYLRFDMLPVEGYKALDKSFFLWVIIITFLVSSFLHGRGFFMSWKASFLEAEKQKRIAVSSRYESLKNQVNPHFLFNSLNVLSNLVYKDQDLAARFIKQLSKVYRYVLDTKEQEVVPLSVELEALEAYIFLLDMRFGQSLTVSVDLKDTEEWVIAPLSLQMLVENAVKHNVISKADPLHVSVFKDEEDYIVVTNNLQPKSNPQESSGIGLPNIQERYALLTDKPVEIESREQEFAVRIPGIKLNVVV